MARRRNLAPRYLLHKQSGRGRAAYYDAQGNYHDVLLPGPFQSRESLDAYGRLMREQVIAPPPATIRHNSDPAVVEVLETYLAFATRHYRDEEGKQTSSIYEVRTAIRALRESAPPGCSDRSIWKSGLQSSAASRSRRFASFPSWSRARHPTCSPPS